MSDERPKDFLGGLPRTRPHRRSQKRPARTTTVVQPVDTPPPAAAKAAARRSTRAKQTPAARKPTRKPTQGQLAARQRTAPASQRRARLDQPAQPPGTPRVPRREIPASPPAASDILSTAVQAAGEIAQIGASLGRRALRNALRRLPRP